MRTPIALLCSAAFFAGAGAHEACVVGLCTVPDGGTGSAQTAIALAGIGLPWLIASARERSRSASDALRNVAHLNNTLKRTSALLDAAKDLARARALQSIVASDRARAVVNACHERLIDELGEYEALQVMREIHAETIRTYQ